MLTRFSKRTSLQNEENKSSGPSERRDPDISWLSHPWTCSKQLKHYPAFSWRKTCIEVHSFVWILNKDIQERIAYIEDMYEDSQGRKMVRVRFFLFAEEIEHHNPRLFPVSREIFITPSLHECYANSIDGIAAVLDPCHFEKCHEFLPQSLALQTFVCYREYEEDGAVNPFVLNKLKGYTKQPTLSCLEHYENVSKERKVQVPEPKDTLKRLNIDLPNKKPWDSRSDVQDQERQMFPRVNDDVEVLCQDSGIRGCWFKCKVLHVSKNRIKVRHYDTLYLDGPEKLEEWVPIRAAASDKLGMRRAGRSTIRPWPQCDSSELIFDLGKAIDVWWCDGWWEGVMIGQDRSADSKLKVYLPGENQFLAVEKKDARISKEWFESKWVSLEPKPDILSSIRSILITSR